MTNQALLTRPGADGVSAGLQERVRAFTAFYEQHAYLAYNLALRITCAAGPASDAVQQAFLRQLEDRPLGLVPSLAQASLRARAETPEPVAAGDASAQSLLAAMSALAPAERAALALADLAEADGEGIGESLEVPAGHAAELLERSRDAFATALQVPRAQADAAARDWMWAAPPNEIWEELYPRFHQTVERQLRGGAEEHTLVLQAASGGAPSKASRRATRRLRARSAPRRWLRRPRRRIAVPLVVLLLGLAAIAATQISGGEPSGAPRPAGYDGVSSSSSDDSTPTESATGDDDQPVKPHKPLTAALLDKLRLRELRQLRNYTRRQADSSLPARQRRAAARRITAIERAARARLRAQQRREQAARDREARQRARSVAPPPPPSPASPERRTSPPPRTRTPSQPSPSSGTPPRTRDEAESNCLMDQDTGQFVCPN